MKTKAALVAVLVLAGLGLALAGLPRRAGSKPADTQMNSGPTLQQLKPSLPHEEVTLIQEGMVTEKQKEHAKLFKGYAEEVTKGKRLPQLVAERGDVQVLRHAGTPIMPRSFSLNQFLQHFACEADAIVVGAVKDKSSQLTEEGAFLFTDYNFTVEEVLKNSHPDPIKTADSITVARAGGAVRLNGHTIRAVDFAQKPLEAGGRYLLFLKLIPTTGAFKSLSSSYYDSSFRLREDNVTQVSDMPFPFGHTPTTDAAKFLTLIRAAVGSDCGK